MNIATLRLGTIDLRKMCYIGYGYKAAKLAKVFMIRIRRYR